ncbi:hypothetical protein FRC11_011949, partial [Ceratobasidium sp. 423]
MQWSHIDLVPQQFRFARLSTRAKTYLARAGQSLLDIHIENSTYVNIKRGDTYPRLINFFATIAPRSWNIAVHVPDNITGSELLSQLVSTCIDNCVPGILTKLSIRATYRGNDGPDLLADPNTLMELYEEKVANVWLHITSLRLNDFYPHLLGNLYTSLTELCLSSDGSETSIPELGLLVMFAISPRLRVVKIGLNIVDHRPIHVPIKPFCLEYLEQLHLNRREPQLAVLLRLIAPGSAPLNLSIWNPWLSSGSHETSAEIASRTEVEKLFARSNVTRLITNSFKGYSQLAHFISMVPTVRVLLLQSFGCTRMEEESTLPPAYTLDTLYVTRSEKSHQFTWPCIERTISRHRVRRLILGWYDFRFSGLGRRGLGTVPDNLYT